MDGLEDRADRLGLALGAQRGGLRVTLGAQDLRLLGALGLKDLGLADTLGLKDGGALVAVGAHLLLHRVLDGGGRLDGLQLDAVDADAPLAGRLVQDAAEGGVDLLAGGQGPLQVHAADDVPQGGDRELLDGLDVVRHLVGGGPGVGHLVVDDGVDVHHEVVLGDHRLGRERHDLLAEIDAVADAVDERDDDVQTGVQRPGVAAETLDDGGAGLLDHLDGLDQRDDDQHHQDDQHDDDGVHRVLPLRLDELEQLSVRRPGHHITTAVAPSISTTLT